MHQRATEIKETGLNKIREQTRGAAIAVSRPLRPRPIESAYYDCVCRTLALCEIPLQGQGPLPVGYKGEKLDCGYRLDLVGSDGVNVEIKAVETIETVGEPQLLTYLKLCG